MAATREDTTTGYRIGYARCSTDKQDLRAQKAELQKLHPDRVYTDEGFTGTRRDSRHGLDQALAALREGDTLVVTKLDRLARSVPDARAIADQIQERGARLQLGSMVYDPADPMGKMFFNMLATFAEFEADLARMRTREGMAEARRQGKLRGRQPKFSERQDAEVRRMYDSGDYTISDIAEILGVSRPTIYRSLDRTRPVVPAAAPAEPQHPKTTIDTDASTEEAEPAAPAEPEPDPAEPPLRAITPGERLDPDTITTERNPDTGRYRVLGTARDGTTVLIGSLERHGRQWHAHSPHLTRIGGHWRTRQEALVQLLARLVEPNKETAARP